MVQPIPVVIMKNRWKILLATAHLNVRIQHLQGIRMGQQSQQKIQTITPMQGVILCNDVALHSTRRGCPSLQARARADTQPLAPKPTKGLAEVESVRGALADARRIVAHYF